MQSGAVVLAFIKRNFVDISKKKLGRYCIPTSDDRPITKAEEKFFDECGTGLGMCHLINMST